MGIRLNHCVALAMLLVAGILISGEQVSAINCDNDVTGLITNCEEYVVKQGPLANPSRECCAVVEKVNVPCLCSHVTKQIESFISMKKVFYVAKFCGKEVPSGTKCGSYTVPSA